MGLLVAQILKVLFDSSLDCNYKITWNILIFKWKGICTAVHAKVPCFVSPLWLLFSTSHHVSIPLLPQKHLQVDQNSYKQRLGQIEKKIIIPYYCLLQGRVNKPAISSPFQPDFSPQIRFMGTFQLTQLPLKQEGFGKVKILFWDWLGAPRAKDPIRLLSSSQRLLLLSACSHCRELYPRQCFQLSLSVQLLVSE